MAKSVPYYLHCYGKTKLIPYYQIHWGRKKIIINLTLTKNIYPVLPANKLPWCNCHGWLGIKNNNFLSYLNKAKLQYKVICQTPNMGACSEKWGRKGRGEERGGARCPEVVSVLSLSHMWPLSCVPWRSAAQTSCCGCQTPSAGDHERQSAASGRSGSSAGPSLCACGRVCRVNSSISTYQPQSLVGTPQVYQYLWDSPV